jgi:TetR/AcrR family transcriptional regulator, tetracycline repressor protein
VAVTSLRIIDEEGLDALSLPRLAQALNVRAPSLYHHFRDKAEILAEVARLIVLETNYPRCRPEDDWIEWFVNLSLNLRRTVLRHRNAAPILLQFLPRDVLTSRYERASVILARVGVPVEVHVLILDGMEKLTLGGALTDAMQPAGRRRKIFLEIDAADQPSLVEALDANRWPPEELLAQAVRSFLRGALTWAVVPEPS